jgi:pimeloyl-ACP methyl ester carboxylesterase
MSQSPLAKLYPNTDWANLFGKLGELLRRDYDVSEDVATIHARTMLVYADADSIRPQHMVECFAKLGGGLRDAGLDGSLRPASQLAIVPGYTHYNVLTSPVLGQMVTAFLDAPAAAPR